MEAGMKKGAFYGVGVGPGDPELLTLKAVRLLERCQVIAAPRTKSGEMLALKIASGAVNLHGKTVVPLFFSMERDREKQRASHRAAADEVEKYLAEGMDVAMLNLGDVSIYATYAYLMELLGERGYETVMIPGVPSFCAVAARLGVSLTEMNSTLHISPGGVSLEETLDLPGTKVLMKSGRQMPATLDALAARKALNRSMLVQNCGLPGEAVYQDLSQKTPENNSVGYFATVIVKE
jgi:precorrin-2/cobalt-factor-2 C20-methyltransferase